MAMQTDRGVPLSTLCPKYLHANSTSHTWPFSAIAELIDNAYDPDVNAKQFWINKSVFGTEECLIFMDNGDGLDRETMHKMLSFGYSDKPTKDFMPIGVYGNGFKSGSMRLGRDAIVFSKSQTTACIGMLSQTYLEKIGAQQIVVPIISFANTTTAELSVREEDKVSLKDILQYSPFKSWEDLLTELEAINPPTGETGTRIIIWNLRRTSAGKLEFDFEKDRYDIQIPSDVYESESDRPQHQTSSHVPESVYSLRAYCSILYLKPRMQIIIRGQKVKSEFIAKSLALVRKDHYKPTFLTKRISITFGYNTKTKEHYGMMMYHKNRLIKAYERVGCQLKANKQGVGVIGVVECNFLNPTHNKQSFDETDKYRKTMNNMAIKLEEYYKEICYMRIKNNPNCTTPVEDTIKKPDQQWVQCDDCQKWRKLPDGIDSSKLPDEWFCRMNRDPQFRNCLVEEEQADSDDERPSYSKTYKQQEKKDKKQEEMRKKEDNRRRQEVQPRQQRDLNLRETPVRSHSTPKTSTSRRNTDSTPLRPSTFLQDDCSPSGSGGPFISNVVSLSRLRRKRKWPVSLGATAKRSLATGFQETMLDNPTSPDVSATSSPSVLVGEVDDDDDSDTTDEIFILENVSTPRPKSPCLALSKVKIEPEPTDAVTSTAGMSSSAAAGAASSAAAASAITQTEAPQIKMEEEDGITKQSTSNESGVELISYSTEERVMKQQSEVNTQNEVAGPSWASVSPIYNPSVAEMQGQQDQLLELMQERDSLKDKVNILTCQLQEMQSRLLEPPAINEKRECSHRASQTEETVEGIDYKTMFEKAKQKVDDLIKEKEALVAAAESKDSSGEDKEEVSDEIGLQVDLLMRELDQKHKEMEKLRSQMDRAQELNANLAIRCKALKLELQQRREKDNEGITKPPQRFTDSSAQTDPVEATVSCEDSREDAFRSLMELRQNVGRLLITYIPAISLDQVNFQCNVIDEILEQYLSKRDSVKEEENWTE